ncbi:MAG: hypothetical protein RAP70_01945, partial [Candidatus Celaenobacter antarcticus]|nr:hypothetical protein [Candidatus Celaenobacter antarcticus]
SLSYAQNINWNLTGAGARAAGFGGAFIGVADDATAISWNPAGLTQLIDPEASAVMRYITDTYKTDESGRTESESLGHFVPNFASGVYPFNFPGLKVVAAVAYQQQLDLYTKWNFEEFTKGEATGGASNISLGLAAEILPIFSIGLASNVWTGSMELDSEWWIDNEWIPFEFTEDFSGFNFNAGAMINLSNLSNPIPVKIGVDFKSPFDLEGDFGEGTETIQMPAMIGFGASVQLGDNFTVSADYETRAYKDKEISYDDGSEPDIISDYNLDQIRAGAEFLVVTDFAVIPLRAGFHTVPTIFSNYEDYPNNPKDQVVGSGFAVGTGLIFEKFALDATATFDSYKQELTSGGDYSQVSSMIFTLSGIFYLN